MGPSIVRVVTAIFPVLFLATGRIDAAEVVIARFGKRISGRYALVTAYYKKPTLRFVVG